MPCNTCSMDGVTITCDFDSRCPGSRFCNLNNSNNFAVNVTVKTTFTPTPSTGQPPPQTFIVVAGGQFPLGCDFDGTQTKTFDITAVVPINR